LSKAEQRDSWLNSGHRTLAADKGEVKALQMLEKVLVGGRRRRVKANSTRKMIDYPRSRDEEG